MPILNNNSTRHDSWQNSSVAWFDWFKKTIFYFVFSSWGEMKYLGSFFLSLHHFLSKHFQVKNKISLKSLFWGSQFHNWLLLLRQNTRIRSFSIETAGEISCKNFTNNHYQTLDHTNQTQKQHLWKISKSRHCQLSASEAGICL